MRIGFWEAVYKARKRVVAILLIGEPLRRWHIGYEPVGAWRWRGPSNMPNRPNMRRGYEISESQNDRR
jgi:hypothetical protein